MNLQDLIPPILYRSLKKSSAQKVSSDAPQFFASYEDALSACSGLGYEDNTLVDVVFEKTVRFKNQSNHLLLISNSTAQSFLAVYLAWQAHNKPQEINIVDFGGACGAHYWQIRPLLHPDIRLNWAVIETPHMLQKAKRLEMEELKFYSSILEVRKTLVHIDLFHAAGSLQYVPFPYETLQDAIDLAPDFIFLNRLALAEKEILISVQESSLSANGPGPLPEGYKETTCRYPITYFPKIQLEDLLLQNYRIKMRFEDTVTSIQHKKVFLNGGLLVERIQ